MNSILKILTIGIVFFIPVFLNCETLFLPKSSNPFFLNSPGGSFSIVSNPGGWPSALQLKTEGKGSNIQLTATNLRPFSLEDKNLILWLKIDGVSNLNDLWIFGAADQAFENRIVFMISDDRTQLIDGQWLKVTLPLSAGKYRGNPDLNNLTSFQFWINDNGVSPVTLQLGPVYTEDFGEDEGKLIFTFDDGWESDLTEAAPILNKYGFSATSYISIDYIGNDGFLTLNQVKTLIKDYSWNIGAHYYDRLDNKTEIQLREIFNGNARFFRNLGIGKPDFSYPNGAFNSTMLDILPDFFSSARTIVEFPETLPPGDPYRIRSLNIVPGFSKVNLQKRLLQAVEYKELLVLIFHKIGDVSEFETELLTEDLEFICQAVSDSGISVADISDLSADWIEVEIPLSLWNEEALFQSK